MIAWVRFLEISHFLTHLDSYFYIGNVYIADTDNSCIRKVTVSTGIITTIAGGGSGPYSGDGGPATSAGINMPHGVAVGASGMLARYLVPINHRI